ncbi:MULTISPECIES: AlpA family transcriptional regulator [unclassified Pseudomonas]|uniref:helix-turn-helix transcriptional regulator n=1 Tax=unclassified Pseudomonas TaxID=196821 RepID=UPI000D9DA271|nr:MULTISPECIES: AlpA family phage regulatory protein [unclassified Pseudomonas]PVZ44021.1 AlpA family transcriptional regulator [Pseudomonas sp. CC120222-01a]
MQVANSQPAQSLAHSCFDSSAILIRMPEIEGMTGLSRTSIYRRLRDDPTFPKSVPLSNSKMRGAPVAWVLAEVQEWVRQRIAMRGEAA